MFYLMIPGKIQAQKKYPKWGKITKNEINITECSFEPDAEAIILFDKGVLSFGNSKIIIEKHRRIKVLKEGGIDHADIEIPFYVGNRLENISGLKAQTINIDADGNPIIEKVSSKNIFKIDKSDNWKAYRFTFPNVKKGSLIEFSYNLYTENYQFLDGWVFQNEIPTLSSTFSAAIPESMDYRVLFEGYQTITKYGDAKPVSEWTLEKLRSIKEEPYVANYYDFMEKIRFQLAGYKRRKDSHGGGVEYVTTMTSWEELALERLNDDNYSGYLNRNAKAKTILEGIITETDSDEEKIKKIHNYVTTNFNWNGKNRIYTTQLFGAFLESRSGNSAEINLFTTLLLSRAGLTANPVLLSTRDHGSVSKTYPFITQFNYMVSNVSIGDKDMLIDATDKYLPVELINREALNKIGYLLDKKSPRWITITPNNSTSETIFIMGAMDEKGMFTYDTSIKYKGYEAHRERMNSKKQKFSEFLEGALTGDDYELLATTITNQENIEEPLDYQFTVTTNNNNHGKQIIYLQPILINNYKENPFKTEFREYPVEYPYPFSESYIFSFDLPDGYEFTEIPKSINSSLPEDFGRFIYIARKTGNKLQISAKFKINNSNVPARLYPSLREFYNIVVAKMAELVVIKKLN